MKQGLLGVVVFSALAAGCHNNSYMSASVTNQKGDPAAILDFTAGISIPEGSAATADIALISHSNKVLSGDVQSANQLVLGVVRLTTDPSGYAFLGTASGTTSVQVLVNGQQVQTVTATVVAPPPSSLPPALDKLSPRAGTRTKVSTSKAHPSRPAPSAPVPLAGPCPYARPSSSWPAGSSSSRSSVGSRARAGGVASVGNPRCARIRRTDSRSVMTASTRSLPWHFGHWRTSKPSDRRSSVAQSTRGEAA
ncbi:MAG: hypothetical protein ACLP1X_09570 [Polyangiaceae bacterium]